MGNAVKHKKLRTASRKRQRRIRALPARNTRITRRVDTTVWKAAVARCVGASHEQTGRPCQDFALSLSGHDDESAIVLADGAGSAKYSHFGAVIAAHIATRAAMRNFDAAFCSREDEGELKRDVLESVNSSLESFALEGRHAFDEDESLLADLPDDSSVAFPCDVKDLSCTLLCL